MCNLSSRPRFARVGGTWQNGGLSLQFDERCPDGQVHAVGQLLGDGPFAGDELLAQSCRGRVTRPLRGPLQELEIRQ